MRVRASVLGTFTCILTMWVALPALALQTIKATEARNHVGETATVCGNVASTHYAASRGRPTFINLDSRTRINYSQL